MSSIGTRGLRLGATRVRWVLGLAAFGTLFMLLLSLYMAGAFADSFVEYFARIRVSQAHDVPEATGSHLLDVLTKILAFPLAYTVLVSALAVELSGLRKVFFCLPGKLSLLFLSLANQLPGDSPVLAHGVLCPDRHATARAAQSEDARCRGYSLRWAGGVSRQPVWWRRHGRSATLHCWVPSGGASLSYDQQYLDPESILHVPSFGRSSLGFLEQVLENFLQPFSVEFQAASSANSEFTNTAIDIGANDTMNFNAFGTILFTLYRDLGVVGIFVGGALYGAAVTNARYRSHLSWRHGALFFMLASAWMMGMMVSPLEAAYFWFVVVALCLLQIANRWRTLANCSASPCLMRLRVTRRILGSSHRSSLQISDLR